MDILAFVTHEPATPEEIAGRANAPLAAVERVLVMAFEVGEIALTGRPGRIPMKYVRPR